NNNGLGGVAAVSANDVWAVGNYRDDSNNSQTLTEHWNGSTWSIVPSPNRGTNNNYLKSVAATASNDVWAVGFQFDYDQVITNSRTLIEHWNGSTWSIVRSPNRGTNNNYLESVAAIASNDVWAVGYYYNGS